MHSPRTSSSWLFALVLLPITPQLSGEDVAKPAPKEAQPTENFPRTPEVNPPPTQHRSTPGYANSSGESSPTYTFLGRKDRKFMLDTLAPLDERAKIIKLAATRAVNGEVRQFAERRLKEQETMVAELTQLAARKRFGFPKTEHQRRFENLFDRSPDKFDAAFLKDERAALEESVERCRRAVSEADDADLRAMAGKVVELLGASLAEAKRLEGRPAEH